MALLKTKPYRFQVKGANKAVLEDSVALVMDAGTGKTLTALLAVARRHKRKQVMRVLIICPKTAIGVWERQCKQHLNIPYKFTRELDGAENVSRLTFCGINYENTWRTWKHIKKIKWDLCIVDESHRIRNRASRQSRALQRIGRVVPFRMILTGTPIGDHETDFWAQFRFLAPQVFGDVWANFDKRYLQRTGYGGFERKFRNSKRETFLRQVAPYVYRVSKSVLGLPKAVTSTIYVPLERKTQKIYSQLENDFFVELGRGRTITTELKITNILRLQQLTGGFLTDDDGRTDYVGSSKLEALLETIEGIDLDRFKNVVFCRFTEEVDLIADSLGKHVDVIDGRTKNTDKVWVAFQDKKYPRQLVVQEETGGIAIDLFAANYAQFFSVTYSWIAYCQAIARIERKGQKRKMTFTRIAGENTIDEDIWKVVDNKGENAELALREFKKRRKDYR